MMAEENNYSESPYVASRTALLARQKVSTPGSEAPQLPQSQKISPSIHSAFQKQHGQSQHPQQQGSIHSQIPNINNGGSLGQFPHMSMQSNPHQLVHQQQQQQQHQQMLFMDNNQTGQSNTINSTANQVDKENRHRQFTSLEFANGNSHGNTNSSTNGNDNGGSLINNGSKSMLSANKSNAIFDRIHIMNSEKPHSFKVSLKNLSEIFFNTSLTVTSFSGSKLQRTSLVRLLHELHVGSGISGSQMLRLWFPGSQKMQ